MTNERIKIKETKILSNNWYTLKKITFDYLTKNGLWIEQSREAYDRGNGAVILLYNTAKQTVILTRQFRMPTYINSNNDGMLIEACAGLLDADDPETAILRETEEETGYQLTHVQKVFEAYMSPGSVTEILYFFIAEYNSATEKLEGGGIDNEDIEVLEIQFSEALLMVKNGEIKDAKTIMLLQYLQLEGKL
ncbi:MAG: GDP-mannose pyrophosphatase NudK [Bacteroidota bacterium]